MPDPTQKPETTATNSVASQFDKALHGFVRSTKDSMKYARLCAEMGIAHFAEHGNTIWLQRFMDAMPANYTRRQAYLRWLVAFAPIAMVKNKLVKDTSENASALDVPGAVKKPFWEFAPEAPMVDFSADDLKAALVNLVKRYSGKRYTAADADATQLLAKIEGVVVSITGEPIPHANDATDEAPAATVAA